MCLAAWVDGQPAHTLPLSDRALHYGDGLFETCAVSAGRPEFWLLHLHRLLASCVRLGIPPPDPELLTQEAHRYCLGQDRAVLKFIYTRGSSDRGYQPQIAAEPRRIWLLYPWPEAIEIRQQTGVDVRICTTRYSLQPQLAGIKHLNRLEQVLARSEWRDLEFSEGLMLDADANVVSGTASNLFCLHGQCLVTPPLTQCGIAGVIRGQILLQADQLGLEAVTIPLTLHDLKTADAVFLSNSVIHIWPVRTLAGRSYTDFSLATRLRAHLQDTA